MLFFPFVRVTETVLGTTLRVQARRVGVITLIACSYVACLYGITYNPTLFAALVQHKFDTMNEAQLALIASESTTLTEQSFEARQLPFAIDCTYTFTNKGSSRYPSPINAPQYSRSAGDRICYSFAQHLKSTNAIAYVNRTHKELLTQWHALTREVQVLKAQRDAIIQRYRAQGVPMVNLESYMYSGLLRPRIPGLTKAEQAILLRHDIEDEQQRVEEELHAQYRQLTNDAVTLDHEKFFPGQDSFYFLLTFKDYLRNELDPMGRVAVDRQTVVAAFKAQPTVARAKIAEKLKEFLVLHTNKVVSLYFLQVVGTFIILMATYSYRTLVQLYFYAVRRVFPHVYHASLSSDITNSVSLVFFTAVVPLSLCVVGMALRFCSTWRITPSSSLEVYSALAFAAYSLITHWSTSSLGLFNFWGMYDQRQGWLSGAAAALWEKRQKKNPPTKPPSSPDQYDPPPRRPY
ncbi:hypothetical protein HCG51_08855 [Tolypothrix sp. PCC 7910]|nr:hypothetical protein HCG51_08855 [Tolypothrix sp. PCC 7910]